MSDENRPGEDPPQGSAEPPKTETPPAAQAGGEKPASPSGEASPAPKPAAKKVAKKPAVMETEVWEGPLVDSLKGRFGEDISLFGSYRGQDFLVAAGDAVFGIIEFLKNEEAFDYLVDLTAVHWPKKEQPFEVIWILYSFDKNARVRIKASVGEGEKVPSVAALHSTANWAEREVYDMFGIEFENHPDLKRILMPDEWEGFPLRKDYGIIQQDADWVRENLKIESAQ